MHGRPHSQPVTLIDRYDRRIHYVRISVTDRCDFRCVYCMDDAPQHFVPRSEILSLEEITDVARAFCALGVSKIRITGGEPLVRANVIWLFRQLGRLPQLRDLTLTTNGSQLERWASALKAAGVTRVNISLDSLRPERFQRITRTGRLDAVLRGIEAARACGFRRLKINSVIMRHRNHDEIADLVRYVIERDMDISFIEEMPLGVISDHDRAEEFLPSDEILNALGRDFDLMATTETTGGPARYYRVAGTETRVGFISPHTHNFCANCNRVRITTEGRLLLCLGQEHSVDLRAVLRATPGDSDALRRAIVDAMAIKPKGHDFQLRGQPVILRHMNVTGG